jgi:excisionase family DNA binding protein
MASDRNDPNRRVPTSESDWLTLGQAAKFLGVAQSTIRKWSDLGRVPAFYTPGGHRRYRRSDLETFIDRSGPGGQHVGPLVLVVDDDVGARGLTCAHLELVGYQVREAQGADEALSVIEQHVPDLVLIDVVMPGADGWELLRRLQERHGAIPVIMFGGSTDEHTAAEAARHGVEALVGKPFDPRDLVERAKQLVPPG